MLSPMHSRYRQQHLRAALLLLKRPCTSAFALVGGIVSKWLNFGLICSLLFTNLKVFKYGEAQRKDLFSKTRIEPFSLSVGALERPIIKALGAGAAH